MSWQLGLLFFLGVAFLLLGFYLCLIREPIPASLATLSGTRLAIYATATGWRRTSLDEAGGMVIERGNEIEDTPKRRRRRKNSNPDWGPRLRRQVR
jgi:hypothetical protein